MHFFPTYLLLYVLPKLSQSFLSEKEIIKCVNSETTTWTADETSDPNLTFDYLKSKDPNAEFSYTKDKIGVLVHRRMSLTQLPTFFDAKDKWPECKDVIGHIRHQGRCLSSWAVAPASVMSDRICIGTKGKTKVHVSAEDILSCCEDCVGASGRPCDGGFAYKAWSYLHKFGAVTGGELRSKEGCQPYSYAHFLGKTTSCRSYCLNGNYKKRYYKDRHFPGFVYLVAGVEEQIQKELFDDGPVMAAMVVYEDITTYRRGVYRHVCGKKLGHHMVKILGWGKENGTKYWLVANSWGSHWGESGLFKILRGRNHCNIEKEIRTGKIIGLNAREYFISNPNFEESGVSGGKKLLWERLHLLPFCFLLHFSFFFRG